MLPTEGDATSPGPLRHAAAELRVRAEQRPYDTQQGPKRAHDFAAVEEGFYKAEQYGALARKSDRELGALGSSHADLPHSVVFGKK